MSVSFKNDNVEISAIRDRAMFHTFAGNQSFVIKDIGDELAITYSASSFVVSIGTGEAVICGGSTLVEGTNEITLNQNESGYIVIRVDLAQTGDNICQFKAVSSLVQENINDEGYIYDFPLARYTTNGNGVNSFTDQRVIRNNITDDVVKTINGVAPTNNNIDIDTDYIKTINNIRPNSSGNILFNNGENMAIINRSGGAIEIQCYNDAYGFTSGTLLSYIASKYNYNTFYKSGSASISDFPEGFKTSAGTIYCVKNHAANRVTAYWSGYESTKPLFKRSAVIDGGTLSWSTEWVFIGGEPVKLWENPNKTSNYAPATLTLTGASQYRKLLVEYKMGKSLHNNITLVIPYASGSQSYRPIMVNDWDTIVWRITNFFPSSAQIQFEQGMVAHPHTGSGGADNQYMIPLFIYGC